MEKWRGKNAVVTGASSGIGAAIVRDLANAGMNVTALARRVDRLEALKKELEGAPGRVRVQKCDVSNKESVNSAFADIEKECGTVHVLVNNAGILR
jgi:NADP+-dependent farnesol dehydrogenase